MLTLLIFGIILETQELLRILFYASYVSNGISLPLSVFRVTESVSFLFFEVIKKRNILMTWILEEVASFEHFKATLTF